MFTHPLNINLNSKLFFTFSISLSPSLSLSLSLLLFRCLWTFACYHAKVCLTKTTVHIHYWTREDHVIGSFLRISVLKFGSLFHHLLFIIFIIFQSFTPSLSLSCDLLSVVPYFLSYVYLCVFLKIFFFVIFPFFVSCVYFVSFLNMYFFPPSFFTIFPFFSFHI